jgi:glycolate oxidase FAD binding subunit
VDLIRAEEEVARVVGAAERVDPTGGGTHREVGGRRPENATVVRAPVGVVAYAAADLTVTVGAGTTVAELTEVLAAAGQECALDPRDPTATVGGTIACGLSGPRRPRVGPLRDQVLEVRFATADGRLVRGGGPTVKNVTGYDIPRLLVGSLGTIGVLTRVILRCRPRPASVWWGASDDAPDSVRARCLRPATVAWDGAVTRVRLEGHPVDVEAEAIGAGLDAAEPFSWPVGEHRGRASVEPGRVVELGRVLDDTDGVRWVAEIGVGTVHVATDSEAALGAARAHAQRCGGWLLREAGAPGLDGFGIDPPNVALLARVKAAFDPTGKLAPGRLPLPEASSPVHGEVRSGEIWPGGAGPGEVRAS